MKPYRIDERKVNDERGERTEVIGTLDDGYTIQIDVHAGDGFDRRMKLAYRILDEKLMARVSPGV